MVTRNEVDRLNLEINEDIEVRVYSRLYWCKLGDYRDNAILLVDMVEYKLNDPDCIFRNYGTKLFSLNDVADIRRLENSVLFNDIQDLDCDRA